jgi:hypothetical protein
VGPDTCALILYFWVGALRPKITFELKDLGFERITSSAVDRTIQNFEFSIVFVRKLILVTFSILKL